VITEATDEYCLAEGEAAKLLAGHPWRRFAVLGDSVAEGLCSPVSGYSELQWADRLAAELAVPDYLNLGVSGLRAHEIHATQLAPALAFAPDLALVVGGGNDAFSARYNPDRVDASLSAMITALQSAGADVITLGMFDVSHSPAVADWLRPGLHTRMRLLAHHTCTLAARLNTIHVHLTDHPLSSNPTLYSPDGRHGTARSDAVATAETIRRLGAFLQ
jgi:lysophospholipase L1-like esterase